MAYKEMEGGCSAKMKCPHCGETIDLNATKGSSEPEMGEEQEQDGGFEEGLRSYMSPRNGEETP